MGDELNNFIASLTANASLAWYLPVVTGVSTRVGKVNPREVIVISFVKVCETFIILFT